MGILETERMLSMVSGGMTPSQARDALARAKKLRERVRREKQMKFKRKNPKQNFRINRAGELIIDF